MANERREKAQRMASRGASVKEIKQKTGLSGEAAKKVSNNYNPALTSAPKAPPSSGGGGSSSGGGGSSSGGGSGKNKGPTLGQLLRIAGGGYGIGKSELDTLVGLGKDKEKISPDKLIRRLDKINAKLSEEDKIGISLKSGAANKIIRKASKLSPYERSQFDFGTGPLGMQIQSMLGDPGSLGVMRKGQREGSREAVEPTLLAKGKDLGPTGREQVRGVGEQYEVPKRLLGGDETTPTTDGGSVEVGGDGGGGPFLPPEPIDTSLSSGAGGLDLASWATGFRRAKSSRQKVGRGAQGLISMKKSPFTSWFK